MEILAGVDPMKTLERENGVREHSSIAKIAMRSVKTLFMDVSSWTIFSECGKGNSEGLHVKAWLPRPYTVDVMTQETKLDIKTIPLLSELAKKEDDGIKTL